MPHTLDRGHMDTSPTDDPIFRPLTINGLTFKNRVIRSSLGGRVDYYDGSMSEGRIAWDLRFARGGVSAIISSNSGIRADGMAVPGYATIDDDRTIPSWRRLVQEVHRYDCRYIIQLHFAGRQRDIPRKDFVDIPPPSATSRPDLLYGLRARRMTIPEIEDLVQDYARAAWRAREAGADGIEIVACNGYILHQFLSSAINDREDEYNGDLRARARLTLEVLKAVRSAVGRDFFVSMKLSGRDEHNAYTAPLVRAVGNTLADTIELSRWLAEAGLDAIHLSQGDSFPHPLVPAGRLPTDDARRLFASLFYEGTRTPLAFLLLQFAPFRRFAEWNWGRRMPFVRGRDLLPDKIEGMNEDDAAKIKEASGLPVICVGGWQSAGRIREALEADRCDTVSIARGLLANPDLVHQFAQGQENPERPCTYCNRCLINVVQYPLACWEEARFDSREQMFHEAYSVYKEAAVGVREV
ncbi:2,4-dienoyl-CoA reductase (NADPH2) [Skermanella aerolata]|uniref:NADH:flavin oxidoreductase n=1 Tax=Skermanella aerolata TaxID=393310 RepID=UPI003D1F2964